MIHWIGAAEGELMRMDFERWFEYLMRLERRRSAGIDFEAEETWHICPLCYLSKPLSNMRAKKSTRPEDFGRLIGLYCCECFYTRADYRGAAERWQRAIQQRLNRRNKRPREGWDYDAWLIRSHSHRDLRREYFGVTFSNDFIERRY